MKIFISGGCKNGKSGCAQKLARAQKPNFGSSPDALFYIATMRPVDSEDDERIARHRREREGWGFTTIEQPVDIEKILVKCGHESSFLLDSLTALLANEMFFPDGNVNENATEKIKDGLLRITGKIKNIVMVSDFIYSDAFLYDSFTEKYMRSLAEIDRVAARNCDVVLEAAYTSLTIHKGREMFEKFRGHNETVL